MLYNDALCIILACENDASIGLIVLKSWSSVQADRKSCSVKKTITKPISVKAFVKLSHCLFHRPQACVFFFSSPPDSGSLDLLSVWWIASVIWTSYCRLKPRTKFDAPGFTHHRDGSEGAPKILKWGYLIQSTAFLFNYLFFIRKPANDAAILWLRRPGW